MAGSRRALAAAVCLTGLCVARAGGADLAVRLLEPDRHCRAGEKWEHTLVVENLTSRPLTCDGAWRAAVGDAPVADAPVHLDLPPRGTGRLAVALTAPAAERIVTMDLSVVLRADGARPLDAREALRLYPAADMLGWAFLKDRKVGVVGTNARLTRLLKDAGASAADLSSLDAARDYEGDWVVAAPGAFDDRGDWSAVYRLVASAGLRVPLLILRQRPGRTAVAAHAQTAASPLAAPDARLVPPLPGECWLSGEARKVFEDLAAPDFAGWRRAAADPRLPLPACPPGNLRRLAAPGRADDRPAAASLQPDRRRKRLVLSVAALRGLGRRACVHLRVQSPAARRRRLAAAGPRGPCSGGGGR